jgi:hypothetical protein
VARRDVGSIGRDDGPGNGPDGRRDGQTGQGTDGDDGDDGDGRARRPSDGRRNGPGTTTGQGRGISGDGPGTAAGTTDGASVFPSARNGRRDRRNGARDPQERARDRPAENRSIPAHPRPRAECPTLGYFGRLSTPMDPYVRLCPTSVRNSGTWTDICRHVLTCREMSGFGRHVGHPLFSGVGDIQARSATFAAATPGPMHELHFCQPIP